MIRQQCFITRLTHILTFGDPINKVSAVKAYISFILVADRAYMSMVAKVDKEFASFRFKLARLLFPVGLTIFSRSVLLLPARQEGTPGLS